MSPEPWTSCGQRKANEKYFSNGKNVHENIGQSHQSKNNCFKLGTSSCKPPASTPFACLYHKQAMTI